MLIPGTCPYIILRGKRDFADMINGMNSEMGTLSWIVRWAQSYHESLKVEEEGGKMTQRDVMEEK